MQTDRFYLELAMQEAELALQEGTAPIGAVIVSPDGQIVSRGRNRIYSANARAPSAGKVTILVFGVPSSFAGFLGL